MKNFLTVLILILLTSCNNPFDKYKNSMDQIQTLLEKNMDSAKKVQNEITDIQNLLTNNPNFDPSKMDVNEAKELNNSLASINAELQAGNMDLLLAQADTYPEETKKILDQVEDYKAKTLASISSSSIDPNVKAEMEKALVNAENIVKYISAKGVTA